MGIYRSCDVCVALNINIKEGGCFDQQNWKTINVAVKISTQLDASIPSIDWPGCVERCNGNREAAQQLLAMTYKSLRDTANLIERAYVSGNQAVLSGELHRCLGGLCYLSVPELTKYVSLFQALVDQKDSLDEEGIEDLNQAHDAVMRAMTNYMRCFREGKYRN